MYENELTQLFVVARVQNVAETETLFVQSTIAVKQWLPVCNHMHNLELVRSDSLLAQVMMGTRTGGP